MNISPEIELVWSIAGQEAIHARREEIEPEHFMCAFLKYAELTDEELSKMAGDSGLIKILISSRDAISDIFEKRQWPTRRMRHSLRKIMGRGEHEHQGDVIHRSLETKKVFKRAVRKAGRTLTSKAILEALIEKPTENVQRALREVGVIDSDQSDTVIDEHDEKLLSLYAKPVFEGQPTGTLSDIRLPQLRVLKDALENVHQEAVLLICEDPIPFKSIMANAVHDLKLTPSIRELDQIKLYEEGEADEEKNIQEKIRNIFDAAELEGIILFLDFFNTKSENEKRTLTDIEHYLVERVENIPLILVLREETYQDCCSENKTFLREFRQIWFHQLESQNIPSTL